MKVFQDKHIIIKSIYYVKKCYYWILACIYFQVNYALNNLFYLLFTLFFYIGQLKLGIQNGVIFKVNSQILMSYLRHQPYEKTKINLSDPPHLN